MPPMKFARILRTAAVALAAFALPAVSQAATKLDIGYIPVLGVSQLFVLQGEGWAKDADLELNIIKFDSGPAMVQALATGKLDAMYGGVLPAIVVKANGVGISVLAATATEEIVLVGRGPYADLVKSGKTAAQAIQAFNDTEHRKLKLATQPGGSVPETVARYWLNRIAKIPADQVDVLGMGIEKTQAALLANAVDAAVIREPVITIIHDLDPNVQVLALGGEIFPHQPGSVLAVTKAARDRDEKAIERLVALHVRATKILQSDPKSVAKSVYQYVGAGLTEQSVIERALVSTKFIADPKAIKESTEQMQQFQVDQGVLPKAISLDELFDSGPYDRAAK